MRCIAVCVLLSITSTLAIKVIHRWKSPVFTFPDRATEERLRASGKFTPDTGVIIDVDRHVPTDRTFVTCPIFANGSTVTLATISNNRQVNSPLLSPYPNWSWNEGGNCERSLISVFRIKIDECNRLWALDSGVTDVFGSFIQTCPPKLVIFDLNTDRVIKNYPIPSSNLRPESLLIALTVEIGRKCDDVHAYIADVGAFNMIVYSMAKDRSWVVDSKSFEPDEAQGNFTISGTQFQLLDGLFALALGPISWNGDRTLYYHNLASNCESSVSTKLLKNESNFPNGTNTVADKFQECIGRRSGQSGAEVMDSNGHLFSSLLPANSIECWNKRTEFNSDNLHEVVRDDRFLQFPSGMKAVPSWGGEDIWIITCRFQLIATTGLNRSEYNFHIISGSADEMVARSGCDSGHSWWVWGS